MSRPTKISINKAALQHNLQRVRQYAPNSKVLAMVKADAYGHGLANVAHALHDADAFGVACLEEANCIRAAGLNNPIILLEGFFNATELTYIVDNDFDIVLHDACQLEILMRRPLAKPIRVWLKIDTGMNRLGFSLDKLEPVWQQLSACSWVAPDIRVMTHFPDAAEINKPTTLQQIKCFKQATRNLVAPRSLANSAGILAWQDSHVDWVRPGIMLYGVSPFQEQQGVDHQLQPVMTLHSALIAIRHCQRGDAVGYGGEWICPEPMLVGIVAAGYGDGYPRHVPTGTPVLVNQQRVPLIGAVSMDMLTVDLRTCPQAQIGDPVILWGETLPVEEIARCANTIPYELLCNFTARVGRRV